MASFCDINWAKILPLYTEKKINQICRRFLKIPFLVTNFYVEEEQDMICWATLNWNVSTEFRLYFSNRHVFDFAGATKGF